MEENIKNKFLFPIITGVIGSLITPIIIFLIVKIKGKLFNFFYSILLFFKDVMIFKISLWIFILILIIILLSLFFFKFIRYKIITFYDEEKHHPEWINYRTDYFYNFKFSWSYSYWFNNFEVSNIKLICSTCNIECEETNLKGIDGRDLIINGIEDLTGVKEFFCPKCNDKYSLKKRQYINLKKIIFDKICNNKYKLS